ncbi:MAG TPA: NAD-dependent epimerase/dehydratase family protein [Burkholderiales bacterium]|nr:NAD-dependent epimerase/dehydratase family protein [Burkholderiales bacterium]
MQKHYLITGGAGFIGGHLAETLLAGGHRVTAIDNLSTGSLKNVAALRGKADFHFVRADIRDEMVLEHHASRADIIVHLAAAVGVRLIVERPVETLETNITGTEVALKAALRYGCRILLASTSEVYGKGLKFPFAEGDDVLLGTTDKSRWAYAATKMIDEFLALAYAQEYGLEVIPVRLFNTVGPRQTGEYGMVVPRFVRQALKGEALTVYGDGTQRRSFCHVADVVRALAALCAHPGAHGRLYNVGAINEISMLELAKLVNAKTGNKGGVRMVPYAEAYASGFEDMLRRVPDISRIQSQIDWKPSRSLDEILDDVIRHEKTAGA